VFLSDFKDRITKQANIFKNILITKLITICHAKVSSSKTKQKILVFKKNLCVKDLCGNMEQKDQKFYATKGTYLL